MQEAKWYLILNTPQGIKAYGGFNDEYSASNFLNLYFEEKGGESVEWFDIFPSYARNANAALKEWFRVKGG